MSDDWGAPADGNNYGFGDGDGDFGGDGQSFNSGTQGGWGDEESDSSASEQETSNEPVKQGRRKLTKRQLEQRERELVRQAQEEDPEEAAQRIRREQEAMQDRMAADLFGFDDPTPVVQDKEPDPVVEEAPSKPDGDDWETAVDSIRKNVKKGQSCEHCGRSGAKSSGESKKQDGSLAGLATQINLKKKEDGRAFAVALADNLLQRKDKSGVAEFLTTLITEAAKEFTDPQWNRLRNLVTKAHKERNAARSKNTKSGKKSRIDVKISKKAGKYDHYDAQFDDFF